MKKPSENRLPKSSDQENTRWYEAQESHFQAKPWMDRELCGLCDNPADFGLDQGPQARCAACAQKEGLL